MTKDFIDFYIVDIKENQKMNIVGAIGPICNVSLAFYNVLSKPIETGYQNSGDMIKVYKNFAKGMDEFMKFSVKKDTTPGRRLSS